jgi:hypothetical protein
MDAGAKWDGTRTINTPGIDWTPLRYNQDPMTNPTAAFMLQTINYGITVPLTGTENLVVTTSAGISVPVGNAVYNNYYPPMNKMNGNGTITLYTKSGNTITPITYQMPLVEKFAWKESPLIVNPHYVKEDGTITAGGVVQRPDNPDGIQSSQNPQRMNGSALFLSYNKYPTFVPVLTPLGQIYALL